MIPIQPLGNNYNHYNHYNEKLPAINDLLDFSVLFHGQLLQ